MFRKILIANRGEIACRVIATCRRLGIRTVAIYSDADIHARHVQMADEAVRIGPPPSAASYLRGDRVIAAAHATGAEAIHPGYGFLSENPGFVESVEAAGLVFIGPTAAAIRAMGLKDAAKRLMEKAGVPVVPGYHGERQDLEFLAKRAAEIGYPVMIKARAGGGGKGMRRVENRQQLADALGSAQREAAAAFGDSACLIEKYVSHPRHIEIQVFGDAQGDVIHLFERDCSLQRRHQKVIEEAPAPGMTPDLRAAMGNAAVEAARAIGYRGAGTVEFIVDGSGSLRRDGFWFMEMNTRLQVEHPVSEAITGLDFVEMQLRIAAGEALPVRQEEVQINGWAFEARLYAEDAENGFLPAAGTLQTLAFPPAEEFSRGALRIDCGVRQGETISPDYDPMIAKVIAHGPTRDIALSRLSYALRECRAVGSDTNLDFLIALADHEGFRRGEVDTGLIERDLPSLLRQPEPAFHLCAIAGLAALELLVPRTVGGPWTALAGWRLWQGDSLGVAIIHNGVRHALRVTGQDPSTYLVEDQDKSLVIGIVSIDGISVTFSLPERQARMDVIHHGRRVTIYGEGRSVVFDLPDSSAEEQAMQTEDDVVAPMPGQVIGVPARVGQKVSKGDVLVILEAMKMEYALPAPRDGMVSEVLVASGDRVSHGALLLALEKRHA